MKAVILVGCSGSGKSTYAKEWCKNNFGAEVNRDDFRKQILQYSGVDLTNENLWKHWKHNKANEKKVNELVEIAFQTYSQSKVNIVVSDKNLNIERRQQLINKLQNMGYEVSVEVIGKDLSLDELWKRDNLRKDSVGHSVVSSQYEQFRKEFPRYQLKNVSGKREAVIFDVDGTLAHMEGRRGAFEWDKVSSDSYDTDVFASLICHVFLGRKIIVMSGRDEVCRESTFDWLVSGLKDTLNKMNIQDTGGIINSAISKGSLFMRKSGDMRNDVIVKNELFFEYVDGVYKVVAVFDDRPKVCRGWYDLGFKVIHCGNPWVEF